MNIEVLNDRMFENIVVSKIIMKRLQKVTSSSVIVFWHAPLWQSDPKSFSHKPLCRRLYADLDMLSGGIYKVRHTNCQLKRLRAPPLHSLYFHQTTPEMFRCVCKVILLLSMIVKWLNIKCYLYVYLNYV